VHAGVFLMLRGGFVHWLLFRSKLGFEFRASGANPDAARYAGMRASLIIVLAMATPALRGAGRREPGAGRAGPRLARASRRRSASTRSPWRCWAARIRWGCFAGLLFGALEAGGRQMQVDAGVSIDLIGIIQALIIVFIAAPLLVRAIFPWGFRSLRRGEREAVVTAIPIRPAGRRSRPAAAPRPGSWAGADRAGAARGASFSMRRGRRDLPPVAPARRLGAAEPRGAGAALHLHRRGAPAFIGARQFLRGGGRWTTLSLGIGLAIFGDGLPRLGHGGQGVLADRHAAGHHGARGADRARRACGVLCERVAVVNIAIEGMLLAGAFTGALMGSVIGGWGGLLSAVVIGGLFGFILAALVVTYRMDQIIAGVVINLFVLGLTSYVLSQVFAERGISTTRRCSAPGRSRSSATSRSSGRCCSTRTSSSTARS
jgi:hypothetical protein